MEKFVAPQLVKKFPALYGIMMFITVFTTTCHSFLSWARYIQSTPSCNISLRPVLIITSSAYKSTTWSPFFRLPYETLHAFLYFPIRATWPTHLILLVLVTQLIFSNEYWSLIRLILNSVEIPTRCSFVIEFIIPKFFKGSTCFDRNTAHNQES